MSDYFFHAAERSASRTLFSQIPYNLGTIDSSVICVVYALLLSLMGHKIDLVPTPCNGSLGPIHRGAILVYQVPGWHNQSAAVMQPTCVRA